MKIIHSLFIALFLSACATQATPLKDAKAVPVDRIYAQESINATVKAVFVRDTGVFGGSVYALLTIDDMRIAAIGTGERLELMLEPGEHMFTVILDDPFGLTSPYTIDQTLQENKTYYYRLLHDTSALRIQRTNAENIESK